MSRTQGLAALRRAIRRSLRKSGPIARRMDRRTFLKSTSAVLAAAAAPRSLDIPFTSERVLILGGGLAGLTAAYTLGKAGVRSEIYEAQSRIGGRVFTYDHFNASNMFCELGGELIDSDHKDVLRVAKELGLKLDDFLHSDDQFQDMHFFYQGRHYYENDLLAACRPLASHLQRDLNKIFHGADPEQIDYTTRSAYARQLDRLSLAEYLHGMRNDVDDWILRLLEIGYVAEFGLDAGNQSCLNLLGLVNPSPKNFRMFGDSDEAYRIHGGNSRLVEALGQAVQKYSTIHMGQRLVKIENRPSGMILTFANGQSVKAQRVICSLPFSTLREVEGISTLGLSPAKTKAILELGYGVNSKQMIGFQHPRWREAGVAGYTYSDSNVHVAWDSSRLQPGNGAILTNFLGGAAGLNPPSVEDSLSDFDLIYPGAKSLYDGNQILFNWGQFAFAKGSYGCPKPGQVTTMVGVGAVPELNGRLHFAGEHISLASQGYMNGAMETGRMAAQKILRAGHHQLTV